MHLSSEVTARFRPALRSVLSSPTIRSMSANVMVTATANGEAAMRVASSLSAARTASRISCQGEASRPITRINANGRKPGPCAAQPARHFGDAAVDERFHLLELHVGEIGDMARQPARGGGENVTSGKDREHV